MKNTLFMLLIVLPAYLLQAQTTIVGVLKQSITKESIPFVNIYIESNAGIGTVSNTEGGFTIKIPTEYSDKNIVFSSIGFKKQILKVYELAELINPVVYMIPETTELENIVVLSKYPNPKKILRKAINKISKNYINKAYQEDFFYRQINYRDSAVSRVLEASLTLSDKGYAKNLDKLQLHISELRKTPDLGHQDFSATLFKNLTSPMGNPHFVFNYDFVRGANTKTQGLSFRNNLLQIDSTFSVFKDFKISLENTIIRDNNVVYVLLLTNRKKRDPTTIDPKTVRRHIKEMKGITEEQKNILIQRTINNPKKSNNIILKYFNTTRVYVNSVDFAILKIDTETIRKVYTKNTLKNSSMLFRATTQYKKDGTSKKYGLSSIQASSIDLQKGYDIKGIQQMKEYELLRSSDNETDTVNASNFSKIDPKVDIYNLNFSYNKEFWNNYNVIKMKSLSFSINGTFFKTDNLEDVFIKD